MIFKDGEVLLNIYINNKLYEDLSLSDTHSLLEDYKISTSTHMDACDLIRVNGVSMYFSGDPDKHIFYCYIYKTMTGTDRWIMFMKDDNEGYALYLNPATNKYEISWYNRSLSRPLDQIDEEKIITCYVPNRK
ncbi:MAG: hypothetical protein LUG89_04420 [Methanosphaera sp.]|nr:hypothetical protein [Methanosphaera sp.]